MASNSSFDAAKSSVVISYALSVIGVFYYFLFGHFGSHYSTPFTASLIFVLIYWLVTLVLQFLFIIKIFFNSNVSSDNQANILALVGPHFSVNNVLNFFWCYYFAQEKFIIAEVILVVNLFNLLALYFTHKTVGIKNISDWMTVHFPATGLPLSWTLYAIFWNGACMFHSHYKHLLPRVLANIFIWEFLFTPLALLGLYQDWSVSLSTSFLMLGLGLRQVFSKTFALQWIFAFVISGIDFIASVLAIVGSSLTAVNSESASNEQAPLLA
ncbi:DEKNAAC102691 [Brettanomyces naardenensis]|uniref:DEKNAAC102691 n=1 Tax=Brettanomyces naardenensis TaxID=13370 RepID=A0A448YL38_BRENA|nr:DEKNAAC102691 [Brettanomyces naardenensis]